MFRLLRETVDNFTVTLRPKSPNHQKRLMAMSASLVRSTSTEDLLP
jgi:hypothetical protein